MEKGVVKGGVGCSRGRGRVEFAGASNSRLSGEKCLSIGKGKISPDVKRKREQKQHEEKRYIWELNERRRQVDATRVLYSARTNNKTTPKLRSTLPHYLKDPNKKKTVIEGKGRRGLVERKTKRENS